jgi:hypothetical protein
MSWITRQASRVAWVVEGIVLYIGGVGRLMFYVRRPASVVGIGLLEGAPIALRGETNAYRVRLVNDTPTACEVELEIVLEPPGCPPIEGRTHRTLAGQNAADVFVVTDWVRRSEIVVDEPRIDDVRFLETGAATERCRVVAKLSYGGDPIDELVIVQDLAR